MGQRMMLAEAVRKRLGMELEDASWTHARLSFAGVEQEIDVGSAPRNREAHQ
jgi:hypothetical protein